MLFGAFPRSRRTPISHKHHPRRLACIAVASLASLALASASAAARPADRLVFERIDSATGKIGLYTMRPDGSGLRAITSPGAGEDRDSLPDWSPDGRRIAFERALGPLPSAGPPPVVGIFVMDADGSHVRQLTQLQPGSGTEDHSPSWSPDGRRIAFMRANTAAPIGASAIYTVNAGGGRPRLVRRMPLDRPGAGSPTWSPDGSRLLFSTYCRYRGGSCGQVATGAQLFTVKPNGRGLRQLTHLSGNSYNAAWSPDGSKIVFARNRTVGPEADLYTMHADGTHLLRITHNPKLRAQWPDWRPALRRQR
jgi:TolB protein